MNSQGNTAPAQMVLVMQIISASLIMGVVIFLGIILVMARGQQPKLSEITSIALGAAAVAVFAQFLFRMPVDSAELGPVVENHNFDPRSDEAFIRFAPKFQTEHIVKMAFLEGAAFFNGVAYLVETLWWSLAAMGFLVFLMLVKFPTRSRVVFWIERRTLGRRFGDPNF